MNNLYWIGLVAAGFIIHQFPAYDLTFSLSVGLSLAVLGLIGLIRNLF